MPQGDRLRIPGKGASFAPGGEPGDLYLNIAIEPHPLFRFPYGASDARVVKRSGREKAGAALPTSTGIDGCSVNRGNGLGL